MPNHSRTTVREQIPHVNQTSRTNTESEPSEEHGDGDTNREKIEALVEMICQAGEESAAALFVLMGTLQNAPEPNALANAAKHLAFTRCGEFNLYGMVDAQIAIVEGELLATNTLVS